MAQLRQDYEGFQQRNAELIAVGPQGRSAFQKFWEREEIPFPALPNQKRDVLRLLGQQFKVLKFGRMPAVIVVDIDGNIRYARHGNKASDIPDNQEVFEVLDRINVERSGG